MPELPDVTVYIEALERFVVGAPLERLRIASPFVLRTAVPPIVALDGRTLESVGRLGKRIVFHFAGDLHLVLHLMIAGRLRLRPPAIKIPAKVGLAAFDFASHSILLTEPSPKKRASLHLVEGVEALAAHDPGGEQPLEIDLRRFRALLQGENHTVKRSLTDPRILSGIGNAYSDEILHCARLSPLSWTQRLTEEEIERLFAAMRVTLTSWTDRLRREVGEGFPDKVTAFREGMAVHGRFRKPCPVCASPVQRIAYANNETNYCPTCQTGGKLLADRGLSRLLKGDWPGTLEELEQLRKRHGG